MMTMMMLMTQDNVDDTQQTIHHYIGSLAFMLNEPTYPSIIAHLCEIQRLRA